LFIFNIRALKLNVIILKNSFHKAHKLFKFAPDGSNAIKGKGKDIPVTGHGVP
jgi:hypothetical protein